MDKSNQLSISTNSRGSRSYLHSIAVPEVPLFALMIDVLQYTLSTAGRFAALHSVVTVNPRTNPARA